MESGTFRAGETTALFVSGGGAAERGERQIAQLKVGDKSPSSSIDDDGKFGKSVEKAADKFGTSPKTVERAVTVLDHGTPALVQKVQSNEVSVSAASEIARLPESDQIEIVARGESEIIKEANRIKREKKAAKQSERAAAPSRTQIGDGFIFLASSSSSPSRRLHASPYRVVKPFEAICRLHLASMKPFEAI